MTTLIVVLRQLDGTIQEISADNRPDKPAPGDEELLIDYEWFLLDAVSDIIIKEGLAGPEPTDCEVVYVDGRSELRQGVDEVGDPLPPGWFETKDSEGNTVWTESKYIAEIR